MILTLLASAAQRWGGDKTAIETTLGVSSDGLHAMIGVLLLLLLALVTGRRLDDWRLWLAVLVVEGLNETIDLNAPGLPEGAWGPSLHDVLVTMAAPTAILLLLRFTDRRRLRQAEASTDSTSEVNSAAPSVEV